MRVYAALMFGLLIACSSEKADEKEKSESSHRVAIDVGSFCGKVVNTCGNSAITVSDCIKSFAAVRVTADCAAALEGASCTEFSPGSDVQTSCFPACDTPGGQSCNGDGTLSTCGEASTLVVLDCKAACSAEGKSWTGECGTSGNGQTSSTEKCWCK
ncbi:MAG: hypothetical protein K0S65_4359 [Labilithrix sp.]|nr:hypothetical protein [Labilithrix sp.]